MDPTYLHRQTPGKPLFSDIIWSRPQQKRNAGKLALIGGSAQGFNSVSLAYAAATKAGIGVIRTLLPDSLKKVVAQLLPESEFAPSTKSGSFSSKALDEMLELEKWADGVLICGDLGHNSETAILLEQYLEKCQTLLTLTGDSVDIALENPAPLLTDERLTLCLGLNQLQRLLTVIRYPMAARSQMTLYQMAELLHALTLSYPIAIITDHPAHFFVAFRGEVSTTPAQATAPLNAGSTGAVWRLQTPAKPFEAISSGVYGLVSNSG